jgi:hypothetical protein
VEEATLSVEVVWDAPKVISSWLDPKRHLPSRPTHQVRVPLVAKGP